MKRYSKNQFINNLEYLMCTNNIKASDLETKAEISAGYISRLKGNADDNVCPSVSILVSFSEQLGCSIDDLLFYDFNSPSKEEKYVSDFLLEMSNRTKNHKCSWDIIYRNRFLEEPDKDNLSSIFEEVFDDFGKWNRDKYTSMFTDDKCDLGEGFFVLRRENQTFYLCDVKRIHNGKQYIDYEFYLYSKDCLKRICNGSELSNFYFYKLLKSLYVLAKSSANSIKLDNDVKGGLEEFLNEE